MINNRNFLVLLLFLMASALQTQTINGTWHGQLDLQTLKLSIVFHFDPSSPTVDSPDQGAKGIKAQMDYISADSVSISMPTLNASFVGRHKNGQIKGTFKQNGMPLPLVLTPGEVKRNRPQTPRPPFPYTTEEVSFINPIDSAVLAGTLTYPTNYNSDHRCPVLLMVSGSGLQDRNEALMDHQPFAVIADHLARHGIATLRYDDRSVGQSTGDASNATSLQFMEDAVAGIQLLRSKGSFSDVGVLGHSEGGMIAFMLAARKQADFIVTIGAPGLRGDSILLLQNELAAKQTGTNLKTDIRQVRQAIKAQGNPWLDFFIDYDPSADIAEADCPALVLNGAKDMQVYAEPNIAAIRRNMPKDTPYTIKVYPGLNHLMQHCTTGLPAEYADIEETIAEEVLDDISEWLAKLPLK
ncbi:MAG: alpha/beta hydrolase [Prevotella sp.]|nr:alpha/beta hydrolase [Prevotella sp.]